MYTDYFTRRQIVLGLAKTSLSLLVLRGQLGLFFSPLREQEFIVNENVVVNGVILAEAIQSIDNNNNIEELFKIISLNKFFSSNTKPSIQQVENFHNQVIVLLNDWRKVKADIVAQRKDFPDRNEGELKSLVEFLTKISETQRGGSGPISDACWEMTNLFQLPSFINTEASFELAYMFQQPISSSSYSADFVNSIRSNISTLINTEDKEKRKWIDQTIVKPLTGFSLDDSLSKLQIAKPLLTANPVLQSLVRNEIPSTFKDVSSKFKQVTDSLENAIKPVNDVREVVSKSLSSTSTFQKLTSDIEKSNYGLNLLTGIIELTGHQSIAKKISDYGGSVVKIATQISDYVSKGEFSFTKIASGLLSGNIFGATLSLLGLGSPSPTAVEAKILGKLDKIQEGVEEIKNKLEIIDKKIDNIQQKLDQVLQEQRVGFDRINKAIHALGIEVMAALDNITNNQREYHVQINVLGNYIVSLLNELRTEVEEGQKNEYINSFKEKWNKAFVRDTKKPLTDQEFGECSDKFFTYAETTSTLSPFQRRMSGQITVDSLTAKLFIGKRQFPIWPNLRVIGQFAKSRYGHPTAEMDDIPNPVIFALGCEAYLKLIALHRPQDFTTERIKKLITKGERLLKWMQTFAYEKVDANAHVKPGIHYLESEGGKYVLREKFLDDVDRDYFHSRRLLMEKFNTGIKEFQANPVNGLVSKKGDEKIIFAIQLKKVSRPRFLTSAHSFTHFYRTNYEAKIGALDFATKMKPKDLGANLPELDTPPSIMDFIEEEFLLYDILSKKFGKGFDFQYYFDENKTDPRSIPTKIFCIDIFHEDERKKPLGTIKFPIDTQKEPRPENLPPQHPRKPPVWTPQYFDLNTRDGLVQWWAKWVNNIKDPRNKCYYDACEVSYYENERLLDEWKKSPYTEILLKCRELEKVYEQKCKILMGAIIKEMSEPYIKALLQTKDYTLQEIASEARSLDTLAYYKQICQYFVNSNSYYKEDILTSEAIASLWIKSLDGFTFVLDESGEFDFLPNDNYETIWVRHSEGTTPRAIQAIVYKLKVAESIFAKESG